MNQELAALETALNTARSNVEIINAQNELAFEIWDSDSPRAFELAKAAEKLARLEGYSVGILKALITQVQVYRTLGDYSNAIQVSNEALNFAQELNDQHGQAQLLQMLGFTYSEMGNYAKGLDYHLKVFALHEPTDDAIAKGRSLSNIGVAYSMSGDSKLAVEYYHRSIELYESQNYFRGCAIAHNSCCVDYTILGDFDSAMTYGKKAVDYFLQSGDQYGAGVAKSSLGEVFLASEDYPSAIHHFEQALPLFESRHAGLTGAAALETQLNLAQAYVAIGEMPKALLVIQTVLDHAEAQHMQPFVMRGHQLLSGIYEKQGDFAAALSHLKLYVNVREKILNEASKHELHNLQIVHETQQILAENERQKKLRELDRQNFERLTQIKNDFLHSATHDMKNPLSVLNMSTFLLTQLVPPTYEKAHDYIKRMNESVQKIRRLVEDILDLARLETLPNIQLERVAIQPLLTGILNGFQTLAEAKSIEIKLEVQPADLIAKCSTQRISQALENLVSNGIKYTPTGGVIQLRAQMHDSKLQLQVIDNGMGIPHEAIPHIFDRFYRVNKGGDSIEGTGLGLSIVKLCIDQHGGKIEVESKLKKGSTFTILLPQ